MLAPPRRSATVGRMLSNSPGSLSSITRLGFPLAAIIGAAAAAEGVPGLSLPESTSARVIATHEEHGVTSPTALAYDEQGSLFVAETHRFRHGIEDNRDRQFWLIDDISSRTVRDRRAMLEKWRERVTPDYLTEKSELIRRLGSPDGDGVVQESGVFADGFDDALDGTAAGVFAYEDHLYFACIPTIHSLPIGADGKAGERGVVADGFGVRFSYSGHDMNGFALGPDGRIYGTIGDRGFHVTTREGETFAYPDQGAVFRFDPDGSNFEVIHTGLRNPKEIAFDEFGNAFSVDNNADQGDRARLVHIVEGADSGWRMGHQVLMSFHRQVGLEEKPPCAWMDEDLWKPESDRHPAWLLPPVANLTAGPSGLVYHPGGDSFPAEQGRFLICDYRGGAAASGVISFAVEPEGAGMRMTDERRFVWGLAATDVTYSWDGRVVISDFVGGWTSHEAGRIVEVSDGTSTAEVAGLVAKGFRGRDVGELKELLGHSDMRVRLRAQLAMTTTAEGRAALLAVAKEGDGRARRHAIWGLGVVARCGAAVYPDGGVDGVAGAAKAEAVEALTSLLVDADDDTRAQSVRALGDAGAAGSEAVARLADKAPRVRMLAALALAKGGIDGDVSPVVRMLEENADRDPWLRHAGAEALAGLCRPVDLLALKDHDSPAVRLAAVVALGRQRSDAIVAFLEDPERDVADEALRTIIDFGMSSVYPAVLAVLDRRDAVERREADWHRLLHMASRAGGGKNAKRLVGFALDETMPARSRREAIRLLDGWMSPSAINGSTGRADPVAARSGGELSGAVSPVAGDFLQISPDLLAVAARLLKRDELRASLDPGMLGKRISDAELPGEARAALLELIPDDGGARELLLALAGDRDGRVALAALDRLVKMKAPEAEEAVRRETGSEVVRRRQRAWRLAGELPGLSDLFVEALADLKERGGRDPAALEILGGAEKRDEEPVQRALAAYRASVEAAGELGPYQTALLGGDVRRGEQVFRNHAAAQCLRCHVEGGGHGAGAGPDLGDVGKRLSREEILESMIVPGAEVASGYGMISATLKDGTSVGGTLVEDGEQAIELDLGGERRRIERSAIESMTEPISAMPPMGAILKPDELRDLVAWLSGRKG